MPLFVILYIINYVGCNPKLWIPIAELPARKVKERPKVYITVTFGLHYKTESSRIDVAIEPYPNRWTHHVLVSSINEIDDELLDWIKEASDFSAKRDKSRLSGGCLNGIWIQ